MKQTRNHISIDILVDSINIQVVNYDDSRKTLIWTASDVHAARTYVLKHVPSCSSSVHSCLHKQFALKLNYLNHFYSFVLASQRIFTKLAIQSSLYSKLVCLWDDEENAICDEIWTVRMVNFLPKPRGHEIKKIWVSRIFLDLHKFEMIDSILSSIYLFHQEFLFLRNFNVISNYVIPWFYF